MFFVLKYYSQSNPITQPVLEDIFNITLSVLVLENVPLIADNETQADDYYCHLKIYQRLSNRGIKMKI